MLVFSLQYEFSIEDVVELAVHFLTIALICSLWSILFSFYKNRALVLYLLRHLNENVLKVRELSNYTSVKWLESFICVE